MLPKLAPGLQTAKPGSLLRIVEERAFSSLAGEERWPDG
jgi:hypothetical protein